MALTTHKMFVPRKMAADYVGTYNTTLSFTTEQDMGALFTLGGAVSSPVFNSVVDMNNYVGNYPSTIATDNIYVLSDPSVYQTNGMRIDLVDPRAISIPAATPARAYALKEEDEGWWDQNWVSNSSSANIGDYVVPTANSGTWTNFGSTISTTSKIVGKIIAKENISVGNDAVAGFRIRIVNS